MCKDSKCKIPDTATTEVFLNSLRLFALPHLLQMLLFSHPVLSHVPLSHLSPFSQSRFFFWLVELKVNHLNLIQFWPGLLRSVLWYWHLSLHMCLMIVCRKVIFHLSRRGQLSTQVLKSPRSTRITLETIVLSTIWFPSQKPSTLWFALRKSRHKFVFIYFGQQSSFSPSIAALHKRHALCIAS